MSLISIPENCLAGKWRRKSADRCDRGSDRDHFSADLQAMIFDSVILSMVDVLVRGKKVEHNEDTVILNRSANLDACRRRNKQSMNVLICLERGSLVAI
jgi:hypothetical protein